MWFLVPVPAVLGFMAGAVVGWMTVTHLYMERGHRYDGPCVTDRKPIDRAETRA